MATVNINASKQTRATSGTLPTFGLARNATSSNSHTDYTSQTNVNTAIYELWSSGRGGGAAVINRSFFFFDTGTVDGTITAIDLKVYGYLNGGDAVRVAKSTAFDYGASPYTPTDFDNWWNILGGTVPYNASNHTWTALGTNTISLNSTAISNANSNSYLNLVLVGGIYDYGAISPVSNIELASGIQFASSTEYPKLAITYTPAGYGNDVNGVASANIVNINDVTSANIVTVNGV
jgi:hypothetical protein